MHAGVQSAAVAVCYGNLGNNLPSPQDVVQLYRSYNIFSMRIYSADHAVLEALRNTNINLMLGTTDDEVAFLAASASNAISWVEANVRPYYPDVKIKYIVVGNELSGAAAQGLIAAMRNLNNVLGAASLGVKVSTAVRMDVLTNTFPPSSAVFAEPYMAEVARFLQTINTPLLVNVYPYFAYQGNPSDISLSYALFQPGAPPVTDSGNGLVYTNLFDAMVDSMYAALEKAGAPEVWVAVSESGWPSAGGVAATTENARAYNQGLIDRVAYGKGTPKKPMWTVIEAFMFAIFNSGCKRERPIRGAVWPGLFTSIRGGPRFR
jgi:exo-beta-1,3-glucanase (GH17 family)